MMQASPLIVVLPARDLKWPGQAVPEANDDTGKIIAAITH
jgi:hypothetical protein